MTILFWHFTHAVTQLFLHKSVYFCCNNLPLLRMTHKIKVWFSQLYGILLVNWMHSDMHECVNSFPTISSAVVEKLCLLKVAYWLWVRVFARKKTIDNWTLSSMHISGDFSHRSTCEQGNQWSLALLFLPRDARSAKRGIAIVSRPSVRPSVRLSVRNVDVPWAYRLD